MLAGGGVGPNAQGGGVLSGTDSTPSGVP